MTSLVLFAVGAVMPVIPFAFLAGLSAVLISIALSLLALFGIGAAITLLTGRSVRFSGHVRSRLGWRQPVSRSGSVG